jgi:two-component system chemotaxis sensor kinase CheA
MLQDPNLISEFVTESLEHLEAVEPLLLDMEKQGCTGPDSMNEIFRAVHSIKGAAGFLGLESIQSLSHAMESLLMRLRDAEIPFHAGMVDPLLSGVDRLRSMLSGLPQSEGTRAVALIEQLERLLDPSGGDSDPVQGDLDSIVERHRRQGHQIGVLALPSRKRERDRLLGKVARIGSVLAVDRPERGQALIASALDIDLIAEAIGIAAERLMLHNQPQDADASNRADVSSVPSMVSEVDRRLARLAAELEYLTEDQCEQVFAAQSEASTKRSFGVTAIAMGLMTIAQDEQLRSENAKRMAEEQREILSMQTEGRTTQSAREASIATEKRAETIRVSVSLLDKLMNLAGELVLGRNQLRQILEASEQRGAKAVLQNIDLITTELQENIMNTRMQPIRVLFDRLPRLVRDIANKLGKQVELDLIGGDVELDRSIIEALADPMTHLLRNALDHGLEDPSGRATMGKPSTGCVRVRAYHERGRVVIEVQDDGRGIDPEKVKEAAIDRGAITREQASAYTDKDAILLVFHPGLSTAREVTDVSGRGVGMDVVRTNIQNLGGQIDVESAIGQGTTFRIHLPLTLAIIPSLIVSSGGERFAIPQVSVVEVVRLKKGSEQLEHIRGMEVLRLRGSLLPLIRLNRDLGIQSTASEERGGNVVVLRSGVNQFGLVVDELHDSEEIVVKPLSQYLSDCGWYAGATILGDGRVALILDAVGMAKKAALRFNDIGEEEAARARAEKVSVGAERRSLVVFANDSDEHFAMPLEELLRLERVEPQQLERIGSKEFLKHRGRAIPLVHLESVLPVRSSSREEAEFFVLIPRLEGYEAGIVASRIVDTLDSDAQPDPAQFAAQGLLGSAIVDDRLTLFIDTEGLLEAAGIERIA